MERRRQDGAVLTQAIIIALFFLWGVANNLNDVLIPHLKKAFFLSDLQSGLVQSAFYLGYFFLALPASIVMRRYGYKIAVLVGLGLFGLGALMFYPASAALQYPLFLAALFVIASGLAFLETSANPLITVLGDPATSERRLNFAQAFNPLGSITAVFLGGHFILSGVEPTKAQFDAMSAAQLAAFQAQEARSTQLPYLVIAAVVFGWAALVACTRFPAAATRPPREDVANAPSAGAAIAALFRRPRFLFGVAAQFFYVGAQVGVWSYMIRYAQHEVGLGEKAAAAYLTWSLVGFMAGRFAGTAAMGKISPTRLMAVFAAINTALTLFAALAGGKPGLMALAATSFFMSIMFPTIFATTIKDLGPLTKTGSSFLVMAIIGGAVFTALMGAISDLSAINLAILVPSACFAVVAAYGLSAARAALSMDTTTALKAPHA
ncbi:L-fucose:H+ symporter permease [Caulobacter segnis]|uniref:L-fucose transporter n=2 Tax=Caulobacter segnis TaxID=88688 RepID=D5VJA1_CAUST|nr:L-fucose:H+ symporter permease [Caulobacter segnis]ADG10310.1 L-fucose transporter [Caulobacter segnis ATCC 21756]AVQ02043.1 L-fucose:H+ symporter permease [Caulobacter segnis]